jgi:HD-GYP domain-containing protein (c-di-GMP phosphodiesterase class II)
VLVGAGLLHDIGKIAVDRKILLKKGPLTSEEWHEIRRHPESGYRILSSVGDMAEIAQAVLAHHERWDGGGYPKGLSGRDIPISGRVLALADAYETMVSDKPYRGAISRKVALQQLREIGGKAFDPELTEMFVGIISNLPE